MAVVGEVVGFVRRLERSVGLMNLRVERVICDIFGGAEWEWFGWEKKRKVLMVVVVLVAALR